MWEVIPGMPFTPLLLVFVESPTAAVCVWCGGVFVGIYHSHMYLYLNTAVKTPSKSSPKMSVCSYEEF